VVYVLQVCSDLCSLAGCNYRNVGFCSWPAGVTSFVKCYRKFRHFMIARDMIESYRFCCLGVVPERPNVPVALERRRFRFFQIFFSLKTWRRMEKISWTDHVRNEEVLL